MGTYHTYARVCVLHSGALRESPPSLMSKPLDVPSVEEEEWNMGEILDKVFAYGLAPAGPGGAGGSMSTISSSASNRQAAVVAGGISSSSGSSTSSNSSANDIGAMNGEVVACGSNTNSGIVHWGTMGSSQDVPSSSSDPQSPLSAGEPPSTLSPISENGPALDATATVAASAAVEPSEGSGEPVDKTHRRDDLPSSIAETAAAVAPAGGSLCGSNDGDSSSVVAEVAGDEKEVAVVSSYWEEANEPAADDYSDPERNARRMEQASSARSSLQSEYFRNETSIVDCLWHYSIFALLQKCLFLPHFLTLVYIFIRSRFSARLK